MRGFLGILAGIVAGLIAMLAISMVGGLLFPSNAVVDAADAEQIKGVFPTLPTGAKVAIILSWFGGPLAGAALAKWIAGEGWAAWTTAAIFTIYVLLTVLILPMPGWLQALSVVGPLAAGLIANHLVASRPRQTELEPAPGDA